MRSATVCMEKDVSDIVKKTYLFFFNRKERTTVGIIPVSFVLINCLKIWRHLEFAVIINHIKKQNKKQIIYLGMPRIDNKIQIWECHKKIRIERENDNKYINE